MWRCGAGQLYYYIGWAPQTILLQSFKFWRPASNTLGDRRARKLLCIISTRFNKKVRKCIWRCGKYTKALYWIPITDDKLFPTRIHLRWQELFVPDTCITLKVSCSQVLLPIQCLISISCNNLRWYARSVYKSRHKVINYISIFRCSILYMTHN